MAKRIDLTGQVFGTWTVLEFDKVHNNNSYWICRCQCGEEFSIQRNDLIGRVSRDDGKCQHEDISRDLSGMTFGDWKVLNRTDSKKGYFDCVCSCGEKKSVLGHSLFRGISKRCTGCGARKDVLGKVFGRLTVISFSRSINKRAFWNCVCECGNEKEVPGISLIGGDSKSCGCLQKEHASRLSTENIVGKKSFGKFNWYLLDKNGNKINCRSSYEVFYWNYFHHIENKVLEYEPKTFVFSPSSRYTPDFYFPDEDKYVEVKGTFRIVGNCDQEQKINELSQTENVEIVFWEDIVSQCNLKYLTSKTYFVHAEKLNVRIEDYLGQMMYLQE